MTRIVPKTTRTVPKPTRSLGNRIISGRFGIDSGRWVMIRPELIPKRAEKVDPNRPEFLSAKIRVLQLLADHDIPEIKQVM
jgi:hypothetical protein